MLNTLIQTTTPSSTTVTPTITDNTTNDETSSMLPLVNDMTTVANFSHQFTSIGAMEAYAVAVSAAQQTSYNLNQFATSNPSPTITNNRMFIRNGRTSISIPTWSMQPKVLFVDDESSVREGGTQWLQTYGCQCDVAADGLTAVRKMQLQQYNMIFMVSFMRQIK